MYVRLQDTEAIEIQALNGNYSPVIKPLVPADISRFLPGHPN
jgi:hypothetical protein